MLRIWDKGEAGSQNNAELCHPRLRPDCLVVAGPWAVPNTRRFEEGDVRWGLSIVKSARWCDVRRRETDREVAASFAPRKTVVAAKAKYVGWGARQTKSSALLWRRLSGRWKRVGGAEVRLWKRDVAMYGDPKIGMKIVILTSHPAAQDCVRRGNLRNPDEGLTLQHEYLRSRMVSSAPTNCLPTYSVNSHGAVEGRNCRLLYLSISFGNLSKILCDGEVSSDVQLRTVHLNSVVSQNLGAASP
ncbi:hypothetical protein FH972_025754 [Carpinus fangiana]|uniref:Uncharacterized protein n=1 Tax=Carpinus fangiana TaxID=176857 RepID=A0A5N6L4H2_9ROSI|nr:hypothetical protein FH972_025754 [Carpinus fangiana]